MDKFKTKIENESKAELAKEIKRMKEILGQEYDFKVSQIEESNKKTTESLLQKVEQERTEYLNRKEQEFE